MKKDEDPESLYAIDYGKILVRTSDQSYRQDKGRYPDEMWLVELNRVDLLPAWRQDKLEDLPDGSKIRVIPVSWLPSDYVRRHKHIEHIETHSRGSITQLVKNGVDWVTTL